jgi:RNA polymerase sigma factor (sigma-70 family)
VDDEELVRAAIDGNVDAFAALVDLHRVSIMRVAYAIADGEADDVAQDAVVKAYLHLSSFRSERSFRPWLLSIVANEARNRRRSFLRREALVLKVASRPSSETATEPGDHVTRDERRQRLLDAVARLPDRDREIVALRYFCELSEAETAAAIGMAVGTVKSRLSRALTRLRAELDEVDR